MTKHRKYKRSQRGGFLSWFTGSEPDAPSDPNAPSWLERTKASASGLGSWFGSSDEASGATSSYTPTASTSSYTPTASTSSYTPQTQTSSYTPTTPQTQTEVVGGRKRRRMRGGKGGLGLTYYATPVSGLKVVEPNEWLLYNNMANLKGGSRKRRCKTRKCKTRKCKTRKCKTRKR